MELATPVRIHRSVVDVDVSASRSRSCVLSVVIWSDTSAVASSRAASFSRSRAGCCARIRTEQYEIGVGMFEYSLPQFCVLSFDQHLKTHSVFLHSIRHDFATRRIISTQLPLIVDSHLRRHLRYVDPLVCIVRQYGRA